MKKEQALRYLFGLVIAVISVFVMLGENGWLQVLIDNVVLSGVVVPFLLVFLGWNLLFIGWLAAKSLINRFDGIIVTIVAFFINVVMGGLSIYGAQFIILSCWGTLNNPECLYATPYGYSFSLELGGLYGIFNFLFWLLRQNKK